MNPLIQLRKATPLFLVFALGCFALCPIAPAVDPPPDGGYPNENTAEGEDALFSVTTLGGSNTAFGFHALYNNTDGSANTAIGDLTLLHNITDFANTATGEEALSHNTTGSLNTANGFSALGSNTTGSDNTAVGDDALGLNATGNSNTAMGGGRSLATPLRTTTRRLV